MIALDRTDRFDADDSQVLPPALDSTAGVATPGNAEFSGAHGAQQQDADSGVAPRSARCAPCSRVARRTASRRRVIAPARPTIGSGFSQREDERQEARAVRHEQVQERSYDAMPEIRPRGRSGSGLRNLTPIIDRLGDRYTDSLGELVAHTSAGSRQLLRAKGVQTNPPNDGLTLREATLCWWTARSVLTWATHALVDSRGLTLPNGKALSHDPRPEFVLWWMAQAEQYRPIVVSHAARAVLYYAELRRYNLSNRQVAWITNDALERVKFEPAAIDGFLKREANLRHPSGSKAVGDEPFCADSARAKFLRIRLERYVELRSVAKNVVWKAIRGGLLRYIEEIGND